VGEDGATHHGAFDMAYLRLIPGMTVMVPEDEAELQHMLFTALRLDGPVAIRYPRAAGRGVAMPEQFETIEVGKAQVVDKGEGALLLGIGTGLGLCCRAARILVERYGLRPTVVNARFLKPLDEELISGLAKQHELVVTVEEGTDIGGFGSAVKDLFAEEAVPVKSFALPDEFIPHGNRKRLMKDIGLTADAIAEYVGERLMKKKVEDPERLLISGKD
jgi:1-deoxy-D-xylulose-5-phosphate synthase